MRGAKSFKPKQQDFWIFPKILCVEIGLEFPFFASVYEFSFFL